MAKSKQKYKKLNSHSVEKMSKLSRNSVKNKEKAKSKNGDESKEIKVS